MSTANRANICPTKRRQIKNMETEMRRTTTIEENSTTKQTINATTMRRQQQKYGKETRVDSPVAHAIITNVALEIFLHKNWRGRKSRAGHHYVITQAPAINQFHKKLLSIFLLMFFLTFLFVKTRDTNGHDRLYFAAKRNGTSNCFHKAFIKWTRIRQKETRARSGSKQANSIKTSDVLAVKTSA